MLSLTLQVLYRDTGKCICAQTLIFNDDKENRFTKIVKMPKEFCNDKYWFLCTSESTKYHTQIFINEEYMTSSVMNEEFFDGSDWKTQLKTMLMIPIDNKLFEVTIYKLWDPYN